MLRNPKRNLSTKWWNDIGKYYQSILILLKRHNPVPNNSVIDDLIKYFDIKPPKHSTKEFQTTDLLNPVFDERYETKVSDTMMFITNPTTVYTMLPILIPHIYDYELEAAIKILKMLYGIKVPIIYTNLLSEIYDIKFEKTKSFHNLDRLLFNNVDYGSDYMYYASPELSAVLNPEMHQPVPSYLLDRHPSTY